MAERFKSIPGFHVRRQAGQARTGMPEKFLIGCAKVIQTAFSPCAGVAAVLGTAAVAEGQHVTFPAGARQGVLLVPSETKQAGIGSQRAQGLFPQVAEAMRSVHKMVAAVKASLVFQHGHIAAGFTVDAQGVGRAVDRPQGFVKSLDHNPSHVRLDPAVENPA